MEVKETKNVWEPVKVNIDQYMVGEIFYLAAYIVIEQSYVNAEQFLQIKAALALPTLI